MSFLFGRDGDISLFRVGTVIGVVGVLLLVGGVAAYFIDQNSYRSPLAVDPYPGAEVWGNVREQGSSRVALYLVDNATTDEVVAYYQQRLDEYSDGEDMCVRTPATGVSPDSATDPTIAPYTVRCLFQRSGLGVSQQTIITIQPGVRGTDAQTNTSGKTVIEHRQSWQP
jgi:hypothetical protein